MSEHIVLTKTGRVTTLTINRPDKKNAITQAMYGAIADALIDYEEDDNTRAFIFIGAGDMFTAGNDLQDFSTGGGDGATAHVVRFLHAISTCTKPLIAAVNGKAIGVGLTMLLHCDLVYASDMASFSAPFVKLGLVPEAASSLLLPASVGMAVANDILLTGRVLNAEEAHQYGLVSRVFPHAELAAAVNEIAQNVASAAPTALKKSKALIRNQRHRVAEHMAAEGRIFAEQLQSPDFAESVAAMMQKRQPVFS